MCTENTYESPREHKTAEHAHLLLIAGCVTLCGRAEFQTGQTGYGMGDILYLLLMNEDTNALAHTLRVWF